MPSRRRNAVAPSVALAAALAALGALACSNEPAPVDSGATRTLEAATATAAAPEEAWRVEMNRVLPPPVFDPIAAGALQGRVAFASTREGPHTVFTMDLAVDATPVELERGSEPAWSPDGASIAFALYDLDGGDEIAVMSADGSGVRRLTTAPGQDRGASWSPDGSQIAFWSERDDGEREIYAVSADGATTRRLTSDSHADVNPAWSPRGDEIAFESYRGNGAEIFAVPAGGGAERRVTPPGLDAREPAWSPDGSEIAFLSSTPRGWALAVIRRDGDHLRKLVELKDLRNPAWSPDGRHLVFAHTPEGSNEDLCVVDAATGAAVGNLTNGGDGMDWKPSWTRGGDGRRETGVSVGSRMNGCESARLLPTPPEPAGHVETGGNSR